MRTVGRVLGLALLVAGAAMILLAGWGLFRLVDGRQVVHDLTVGELASAEIAEFSFVRVRGGDLDLDRAMEHVLRSGGDPQETLAFSTYIPLLPAGGPAAGEGAGRTIVVAFDPDDAGDIVPRDADGALRGGRLPFEAFGYLVLPPWRDEVAEGFREILGAAPDRVVAIQYGAAPAGAVRTVLLLLAGAALATAGVMLLRRSRSSPARALSRPA